MHLDGRLLVHEDDGFARARRGLSFTGFIAVTLVVDRRGQLATEPVLHIEGIPDMVHDSVREAVAKAADGKRGRNGDLEEQVRIAARRAAQDIWGKKPVVRVQMVEV